MEKKKNGVTPLTDAQRQLVIDHIHFAEELARKFEYLGRQKGITLLQLKTESCSALCEAALRYEPEAGTDFKAYALGWCQKFIKMCLNDWGYAADDVEVLEGELLAEDEEEMEQWRVQRVEAMMSVLNMQEKKVVRLLYGFDGDVKDFREVARIMHLTPARVHQIYEKALTKMENLVNDNDNENDNLAGARSSDENEAASPSVNTAAGGSAFPECYEVMGGSFADTAEGGLPPHLGRAGDEATAIPYRLIVEALQELLGGIPAHGSRNNFIFTMAAYLRYVCNDDPEWIASILPTYGETAEKWRRTIDSACQRAQYKVMPQIVRRALAQAQARQRDSVEAQRSEEGDNLPPAMPRKLPRLIAHLVRNVPEVCRPAVANAVFPALAAHLKGVKFPLIDGTEKEATFMCVTMAKQSSGKSAINKPIEYITADIVERDEINRKREQEWKDASANKASNKEKPKRPDDLCVQVLVSDMTNAAFVQRLKDAGGRYLYTNLEELELLKQLQTNGTKDVGKIICLCFDNGKYGQERVGTQSVTARVEVRWNWNAASTIQKGIQFFRGRLVDGTLSRVNFCTILPDKSKPFTYGTYDDAYAGTLKPYITNLNLADGRIECRQALDLARRLEDKCAEEGTLSDDEIYQDLAHRAVTIAYLKAMVLYIASDMTWTKEIGEFAEWSLQYDLWCKMHFFGELMREEEERENVAKMRSRQNLLDLLPDTFTLQNALDVRRARGMSESGCRQMIRQWIFRGYIDQEPTLGIYIKTEKYLGRER